MATIICKEHRPQMSTVRPGVMRTKPKDEQRAGTVEKVNIHFDKSKFKVRILETVKEQKNQYRYNRSEDSCIRRPWCR